MRKHFLLSIVALILAISLSSFAYADEILFRGIPWGTTLESTLAVCSEYGIFQKESASYGVVSWDLLIPNSEHFMLSYESVGVAYTNYNVDNLNVAGHEVYCV